MDQHVANIFINIRKFKVWEIPWLALLFSIIKAWQKILDDADGDEDSRASPIVCRMG
ncbi:hypothetical protein PABG_11533 [Paracoccidioides brasiliensis Pb03]|nr:hypothetical protein PABG_11533 [Paracoccidioides brasiliensis Pb03]